MSERSWSDADLARALAASASWRGVMRHLGLNPASAGATRTVRRAAGELGLSSEHFTGQRRWSDDDLAAAVARSRTWHQVQELLGLAGGGSATALKGHALRLGLDTRHFVSAGVVNPDSAGAPKPHLSRLARAGSTLAASWFIMCGYEVTWPLEPCRYDLVVARGRELTRVQVKTCLRRAKGWQVSLTTSGHPTGGNHARTFYDPDEIDSFFVIDADLNYYLIPIATVAGRSVICLSAYQAFRVGRSILELPLEPQPT